MSQDVIARARPRDKGHWYEDFEPGRVFVHHWGRTLSQAENALFTTLTLHFNPQYTNVEVNWGMACALGGVLLTTTLILYAVYRKVSKSELSLG